MILDFLLKETFSSGGRWDDTQCARADLQEVILSSPLQIDDPMVLLIAI